jgi:hypothetical protein
MYDDLRSTTTQLNYLSTPTIYDDDLISTTTQSTYLSTSTMYDDVDLKSSYTVDVDR